MIRLAIVSPCYNEEEVLETSVERLTRLYRQLIQEQKITEDSFFLSSTTEARTGHGTSSVVCTRPTHLSAESTWRGTWDIRTPSWPA